MVCHTYIHNNNNLVLWTNLWYANVAYETINMINYCLCMNDAVVACKYFTFSATNIKLILNGCYVLCGFYTQNFTLLKYRGFVSTIWMVTWWSVISSFPFGGISKSLTPYDVSYTWLKQGCCEKRSAHIFTMIYKYAWIAS